MQPAALKSMVRHLHSLIGLPGAETQSDKELLDRFVRQRDEPAFAELVRRHGPLVWGVCWRILQQAQDAEDVFQATFVVLARKAASVGWHESVGNWLHSVAHRLALKAHGESARRLARQQLALTTFRHESPADPSWREVGALLDEELAGLPVRLRGPLTLCYLEGRTRDEAAQQLGWSLATLKRRLERGRALLRARLTRRGVTLSAALLTTALAPRPTSAALVTVTARGAFGLLAGQPAANLGISPRVARLAESGVHALAISKWKIASALVVVLGLLAGVVGPLTYPAQPAPPVLAEQDGPTPPAPPVVQPKLAQPAPGKKPSVPVGGDKEKKTELAIAAGLQWLARHQAPDGHWSLHGFHFSDHCNCTGFGMANDVAGTAFGLLPLLGAGETHRSVGPYHPYARNVQRGLRYLVRRQDAKGSFGGGMYAQALATMALCEAYRLTHDPELKGPVERALAYIVDAQHPTTGGWGYAPGQRGDTSVTSWQILALSAGKRAGWKIPKATEQRATTFLDSVGTEDGSAYGYVARGEGQMAMTAAGLFCRLELGWEPGHAGVAKGTARLGQQQPPSAATANLYYYYDATLLMARVKGEAWKLWEPKMRQLLLDSQDRGDDPRHAHQKGSWSPARDVFGSAGGRVMTTSQALLILETCARDDPPLPPPSPRALKAKDLDALWNDLADDDFPTARQAMRTLAAASPQTTNFLKQHLKPVPALDAQRVDQWVADLNHEEFAAREQATRELTRLGDLAVPALQKALEGKPALEARRRIEQILQQADRQEAMPARMQALRAIEVLVQIGTPEARQLLQALAGGAPESGLTRAARTGLERPSKPPTGRRD